MIAALVAAVLASQVAAATPRPTEPVSAGRYVLHGTARLRASGLPAEERPVTALALVAPGAAREDVLLHLRAHGFACDLRARLASGGALTLPAGQLCRIAADDAERAVRVDARLREGRGRLRDGELSLEASWDLAGTIRMKVPGLDAGGTSPWMPEVDVRGDASADVRGGLERERGAGHRR